MFKVGDHIVYGTNGVCRVTDVCASPIDKKDPRLFYTLKPVSGPANSVIYTPVDNDRVPMRPLMSADEVEALFSRMADIPHLEIRTEKARRDTYRSAISAASPDSYVAVIKTIGGRRAELSCLGRRLPEFEIECDGIARRHLCTELSVVLGLPMEEMQDTVAARLA